MRQHRWITHIIASIIVILSFGLNGCGGHSNPTPQETFQNVPNSLIGTVTQPNGDAGANALVVASKLENGVTPTQARILALKPRSKKSFLRTKAETVQVGQSRYATFTDVNGFYAFTNLPPGNYHVEASGATYKVQTSVSTSSKQATVTDMQMELPGTLSGTCLLEDESTDHSGTYVILKETEYIAYTETNGSFELDEVPAGTYQLGFWHEDYEPYDYTGDITVTAGGTHPLGQVNLEYISGGTIDGTITAQDDQAVEEAMVKLDNSPYFALTDSNGEYQMDGIRIGTYTVTISHSLIETSVQETSVAISKTATAIVDKSLTDNAPPVWESTPGVLYAFDLDPETDDRLAVEFNRALDACPPVTYVLYYDLAESWDPDNWANNNPAELSSGDLYEGIKADYGYLLTGLTAGSRYIFGIRAKDRHDNIEYNTAEYISVPNDGTVTAAERENLLAAIGRVGIGTTNPSGLFHVQPLTGEAFVVSEADGYVGIGTSTPSEALTVGSDNFTVTMTGEVTAGDWKGSAIGLTYGGTGATDASGARTNLGLGGLATLNAVAGGAGGTITDASITDADINSAAGISGTKIDPDFGAQHVITTGTISVGTTLGITAETGMIRWDGTNFKGYNGTDWQELDSTATLETGWARSGSIISTAVLTDEVGIGTSAPTETLTVNGNINVGTSSTYYTGFSTGDNIFGIYADDQVNTGYTDGLSSIVKASTGGDGNGGIRAVQATGMTDTSGVLGELYGVSAYAVQNLSSDVQANIYGVMGYAQLFETTESNTPDGYLAGVMGIYDTAGVDPVITLTNPGAKAAVIGVVKDNANSKPHAAVMAFMEGDSTGTTVPAAFKAVSVRSTAGGGFDYGLDLFDEAGYGQNIQTADIRFSNGSTIGGASADISIDSFGRFGIGTSIPSTALHVLTDEADANVTLVTFDRTTASAADDDSFNLLFNHENDNNEVEDFAMISLIATDVSDGTEAGALAFSVADGVDGLLTEILRLGATGITLGETIDIGSFFVPFTGFESGDKVIEIYAEDNTNDGTSDGIFSFIKATTAGDGSGTITGVHGWSLADSASILSEVYGVKGIAYQMSGSDVQDNMYGVKGHLYVFESDEADTADGYLAGVLGLYETPGVDPTVSFDTPGVKAALIGLVKGDVNTIPHAAVMAFAEGTTTGAAIPAAFKAVNQRTTANLGFNYGLDLLNEASVGDTINAGGADIRLSDGGKIGGPAGHLLIDSSGKVGVGITPQRTLHVNDVLRLEPQAAPPTGGLGDLYVGTDNKLYFHNGTAWKEVSLVP